MELNASIVKNAYLFLKNYAYHENLNLFLKQRVAAFEIEQFDNAIQIVANVLSDDEWDKNPTFKKWLDAIDYHLLPKSVQRTEDDRQRKNNKDNGWLYITNNKSSDKYYVSKVNYLINAPVELHIIEVLWCITAGRALDGKLTTDCYGNRMHDSATIALDDGEVKTSTTLFKRYVEQYDQWRDQAIDVATEISKHGDDVALLSLDLKSYFYHIDLDFKPITSQLKESFAENHSVRLELSLRLTEILESIFRQYNYVISKRTKETHIECQGKHGLPIGFASSSIIANWYLSDFDGAIAGDVRPAYYGRYVDDVIMVFKRPDINHENPIEAFIGRHLKGNLIKVDPSEDYSILVGRNFLPVQKDKLILQFFDKKHSRAGLEVFKQELDERSSAFRFLPSDHIDKGLDKFAYDVLYDGSANKLRSIVGLAENETELAKYLSSHITAHRLCKLDKEDIVLPELSLFFKGQNALQFSRLWEKVYQYALIIKKYTFIRTFYEYLDEEIQKIDGMSLCSNEISLDLTKELHRDLTHYNKLSLAISLGLLDIVQPPSGDILDWAIDSIDRVFSSPKQKLNPVIQWNSDIHKFSWNFRASNLIRHHLIAWPLANYANYNGDLTNEPDFLSESNPSLDDRKLELSPRFIHFDEWQLFNISGFLKKDKNLYDWFSEALKGYESRIFGDDFPVNFEWLTKSACNPNRAKFSVGKREVKDKIRLAIANMVINEKDIAAAIRKDKKPNVSFERQERLYHILNSAIKEKADIVVMPEVAIPVSWLPFMVAFARRHQIGIIFGLEHWVADGSAYNLIIEALPFRVSNKYKSCAVIARLKNHYAPAELSLLDTLRLKAGNESIKPADYYHKVSWRGVSFATYNCFELSDISHRVLFKSEIDILFACVWNKDTNYYQYILESAVRDLHCYTVQSNTSQYGGSCILRPTKTENKTMLFVKGGENSCVLTTEIDIAKLRDFQFKSKPSENDDFKHLPPGFNSELVLER